MASIKEFHIKAQQFRAVIVDKDGDGLGVSVHAPGAHVMCTLDREQAFELLRAIQSILENEQ